MMDEKDKQRVLQSCHSHPTSGHFGISKTWQRISERFYWKGLSKDVKNMVRVVATYNVNAYNVDWCILHK